ncbi:MAG: hypothetical protein Q8Q01_02065 [archaeon]|nr:hypothetical protein [archaeon]
MVSEIEFTLENVFPHVVTDVMRTVEAKGKQPAEDFSSKVREALLKIIPEQPSIEEDIWDEEKKSSLIEQLAKIIEL